MRWVRDQGGPAYGTRGSTRGEEPGVYAVDAEYVAAFDKAAWLSVSKALTARDVEWQGGK